MYGTLETLQAIDQNWQVIMSCLGVVIFFVFVYLTIAVRMAIRQKVYVVPFIGAALFFWHDFTFVLMYDKWFNIYNHWWLKMWWFALIGSSALEAFLTYQVIRYGHRELWPKLSKDQFRLLMIGGTLAIGAMWALVKTSLSDEFFFISFAVTAVWSVPFHTGLLSRRQSRAGQSVIMELSTIPMLLSLTVVFSYISPFFSSPLFLTFVGCFTLWPLVNVWLILKYPRYEHSANDPVMGAPVTIPAGIR